MRIKWWRLSIAATNADTYFNILSAKNSKKKKKNKGRSDPVQNKLKELSATNNPVEEEETSMNESKWLWRHDLETLSAFVTGIHRWLVDYPHKG